MTLVVDLWTAISWIRGEHRPVYWKLERLGWNKNCNVVIETEDGYQWGGIVV